MSGFTTLPISKGTLVSYVDINTIHQTHIWSQLWVAKQEIKQAQSEDFDQKELERKLLGGQGASYCVGKDFQTTVMYPPFISPLFSGGYQHYVLFSTPALSLDVCTI